MQRCADGPSTRARMNPTTSSGDTKKSVKRSSQHISSDAGDGSRQPSPVPSGSPDSPVVGGNASSATTASSSSNFRNVSACNRCRLRKNRCDQKLPACTTCEKAGVKCVGFDPVSKREIPRSYVYYLESRVAHLESLLDANSISYPAAEDFTLSVPVSNGGASATSAGPVAQKAAGKSGTPAIKAEDNDAKEKRDREHLNKLVSNIGMVSVQGASDPRYLGATSGISFARVVFAAVKSSVSHTPSERGSGARPNKSLPSNKGADGTTMRDSFFGLNTRPTFKPAPFPDRELGGRLASLYFEHANPQMPILHRGEFMSLFDRVYAMDEKKRTLRDLYLLNIVFAIGAGIIMDASAKRMSSDANDPANDDPDAPKTKRQKMSSQKCPPEEYHAAAMVQFEALHGTPSEGFGGGMEELQAMLLMAGFALLRPVAPGLWYIVGVLVRLATDLGLHYEEEMSTTDALAGGPDDEDASAEIGNKSPGRKQAMRDRRRRLWWCTYSFDRLVSTCVGRPVGITDLVVTTDFPSLLDDKYITTNGFKSLPEGTYTVPTYKHVSHHYFRLRLLQSEILQVLQHRQAQAARALGKNLDNPYMHTKLPSPFLQRFPSFRDWRIDVDRRLWEWKESSPSQIETGVQFNPLFLELNYWQAVIMLYRQSLSVPAPLKGELDSSTGDDVQSPGHLEYEEFEDQERVFLKVAEAGQSVLKIYRQLHRKKLVNYTFLATHHLFMSGISFLYALWHSPVVRSKLTLDDVDFTVLAATSVLGDLIEKCPPAEACRDAFDRMAKATISMCESTTGFGEQALAFLGPPSRPDPVSGGYFPADRRPDYRSASYSYPPQQASQGSRRPTPHFDMNLRDLFSEDDLAIRNSPARQPQGSLPMTQRKCSDSTPTSSRVSNII